MIDSSEDDKSRLVDEASLKVTEENLESNNNMKNVRTSDRNVARKKTKINMGNPPSIPIHFDLKKIIQPMVFPELDSDEIKKRVKLSYDGRQLMVRIPREITDFYNLKKGDVIEFIIDIPANDTKPSREIPMSLRVMGEVDA